MQARLLRFARASASAAVLALSLAQHGAAAERLNVLCAADNDWCELMRVAFEKESGVKVSMVRKSAGEIFAQVRAEAANPKTQRQAGALLPAALPRRLPRRGRALLRAVALGRRLPHDGG
ncbi:MAG TPA: hypothetical protein VFR90_10820 [Methylibium sp.]|uniref:hypothetical protein n=1 Tax=Methylibium sp. TaxID=2067992 RepID=UPI002DBE3AF9|nr:hypothetical protein [Methylibium sp.]HEU4459605.1 hypothetical protein [Methylibium sp.]